MKSFVNLLVIGAAAAFGYFAEPSLRLELTGISPVKAPPPGPKADPRAREIAKINLLEYAPEQLPKEVLLKKATQVTDKVSGTKMLAPADIRVKVLRLEDGMVIFTPGAPTIEGAAEVTDTDIREQLLDHPPAAIDPTAAPIAKAEKPVLMDPMAKEEPADSTPAPAPAAEKPAAPPAETAAADPTMKEPAPGPNPALAPEAPAASAPAAEFTAMVADDIVKAMQENIKSGQVKALKFEDILEWTAGEPQTVDGKQVNTGTVSYKTKTFLGIKTFQAKAHISGGKVTGWINVASGTQLE